jgi:hypothetical protein
MEHLVLEDRQQQLPRMLPQRQRLPKPALAFASPAAGGKFMKIRKALDCIEFVAPLRLSSSIEPRFLTRNNHNLSLIVSNHTVAPAMSKAAAAYFAKIAVAQHDQLVADANSSPPFRYDLMRGGRVRSRLFGSHWC